LKEESHQLPLSVKVGGDAIIKVSRQSQFNWMPPTQLHHQGHKDEKFIGLSDLCIIN
jgi:hypothetical protein